MFGKNCPTEMLTRNEWKPGLASLSWGLKKKKKKKKIA